MSRIQSLLRLGAGQNLCFGVQVVDKTLLTELVDINISTPTSLKGVISNVMGTAHEIDLETHYGVIEILPNHQTRKKEIVFGHIVPHWNAQRGNLQVVSWLLRIEVARGLNSGTQGFAGRGSVGDYEDIVGPFDERGLPIRYLLDKIVAQSTGSSWIAQVNGKQAEDLNILKARSAWMVLEYKRSDAEYAPLLNSIAAGLAATPDTD